MPQSSKANTTRGWTKWVRQDQYHCELTTSRWVLFKSLIRGSIILKWFVPATKKDKTLHLKGWRA